MSTPTPTLPATRDEFEAQLEGYRRELTGYCYRMLGSAFEAEDAVQDAFVRAWRAWDRFEGRSSLRTWLYRIATNVCLDALDGRQRRARPVDLGPAAIAPNEPGVPLPESTFVEPAPDDRVLPTGGDPADVAVARESVRLAFVAALQHLPPKQRAVLVLREVLRWQATEVAALLDTSVASVNSALQRARATLATTGDQDAAPTVVDDAHRDLLDRYVAAFEAYDLDTLTSLLREDVAMSMPPFALWLRGPAEVRRWLAGPGAACAGSRLVPVAVNGGTGFGQYKPVGDGTFRPWALNLVTVSDGVITELVYYLDTERHFPLFGLPDRLT